MAPVSALCQALLRALRGEASSFAVDGSKAGSETGSEAGSAPGHADRSGFAPRALASVQVLMLAGLLPCTQGWAQTTPRVAATALPTGNTQKAGTSVVYGPASVNPATGRLTATLKQTDATNIVDWRSFDIGSNAQLNIVQPSATAVLLNKVAGGAFQNKTVIDGVLSANGRVYLYNPNGIVFGKGGVVNVGGLIASTLKFDEDRITGGLLRKGSNPVLGADPLLGRTPGAVVVEGDGQGRAGIHIASGGLALLAGPNVINNGQISAPDGQVIVAAGGKVYLAAPNVGQTGTSLRGLLVEVSNDDLARLPGGDTPRIAENGSTGRIEVGRGNATMVGYAVNQMGLVSATTTVNLNGSIYLRAQDQAVLDTGLGKEKPTRAGPLVLGEGSVTEVKAVANEAEKITASARFDKSQVVVAGLGIEMQSGAKIVAPGGNVTFTAKRLYDIDPGGLPPSALTDTAARVDLAAGSEIDVSGSRGTTLSMESNVVEVELRGTELADNVVLRESPLYASKVRVDARQGTPVANISGYLEQRQFGLGELNTGGGTVSISADAALIQRTGSRINVDGGWVDYLPGKVNTSQLRVGDALVDIGKAKAGVAYTEVVNLPDSSVPTEAGYRQGASAGTVSLSAPVIVVQGDLSGQVTRGSRQRDPAGAGFPLGGSLQVGRYEGLVRVGVDDTAALKLPTVGEEFSASVPAQKTLATQLDLDTQALTQAGFSRIGVQTRGDIEVVAPVALPVGGQLRLDAALRGNLREGETDAPDGGHLSIKAPVTIPSGTLSASGVAVDVAAGITLDVAGRWTNDTAVSGAPRDPDGNPSGLLANRGGSISLVGTSVQLGESVQLDVSAGASMNAQGRVSNGSAGSISLRASPTDISPAGLRASQLVLGPGLKLRGYGFDNGGRLSLSNRVFALGTVSAADLESGAIGLAPSFFQQGGFTAYEISAGGDLTVAAGTTVQPRAERWRLGANVNLLSSGRMDTVATAGLAPLSGPAAVRASTSLTLRAATTPSATPGRLRLLEGSRLDLDPGAALTLSSFGSLEVYGTVHAPAGRVTMSLLGSDGKLWFGPSAAVLAEGSAARIYTDGTGVSTGEMLEGGRILLGGATGTDRFGATTIDAAPGYIVMNPGAVFDVSGIGIGGGSQPLGFRSGSGVTSVSGLGGAGGSIEVRSSVGLELLGSFRGGSGGSGSKGGSLTIDLQQADAVLDVISLKALRSRTNQLRNTGYADYLGSPGAGTVLADSLNDGQFASLTLRSANTLAFGLEAGDVALSSSALLRLDAPTLLTDSGKRGALRGALEKTATEELNNRDASVVQKAVEDLKTWDLARGITDRDYTDLDVAQAATDLAQARLATQRLDLKRSAQLTLSAPVVQIGNSVDDQSATEYPQPTRAAARSALSGNGTLQVNAGTIDLIGHSALQGFGTANLSAAQDLRLIGIDWFDPSTRVGDPRVYDGSSRGSFWMNGQLNLGSAQTYPTTLTDFTLAVGSNSDESSGRLSFTSSGKAPGPVLSAGGSITALAPHIVQSGRVVAPFGRIALGNTDTAVDALLTADLSYSAGSVTSVAGNGPVPLGVVLNGSVPTASTWVATLPGGTDVTLVQNPVAGAATPQRALPSKSIASSAGRVNVAEGATIDLSGGGELFAYGFTPGRGGSQDVLANNRSGTAMTTFAILPGFTGKVAPVDGGYGVDGGLAVGDAVWLSAQGSLPAGLYTLLPAHYALMPGAFTVTAASGTRDLQPSSNQTLTDGSYLVSGRWAQAGNSAMASRAQGFAVAPNSVVRRRSEFALYDASRYFADKAKAAGLAAPALPRDGGHVVFDVRDADANALRLDGKVKLAGAAGAAGASGGLAGLVDIAAKQLEITSDPGVGAGGAVRLSVGQLADLQARSLSLGAVRSDEVGGTRLSVRTDGLRLANDAAHALTAPEIILSATGSLRIEQGADLRAVGPGGSASDLLVSGPSAVLRASGTAGGGAVVRGNASDAGSTASLDIGREALISAAGALQIDALGRSTNGGKLRVGPGGDLTLAVPSINLGASVPAAVAAQSFTLDAAALDGFSSLSSLSLNSRSTLMGLYGPLLLGGTAVQKMTLAGPGLASMGTGGLAQLQAGTVRLLGAETPVAAAAVAAGETSELRITADRIELGGGNFTVQQFQDVNLTATGDLRGTGQGGVLATAGDLHLDAARITVASGADAVFRTDATLTLAGADRPGSAALAAPAGFGGRLGFEADTITARARVEATSGVVAMQARSGLTIGGGSISAAGATVDFAGATAYSPGGRVVLNSPQIVLGSEAALDVSARGADAGSLTLTALGGTAPARVELSGRLRGGATAVQGQEVPTGGRFSLDTDSTVLSAPGAFGALNEKLNDTVDGRATGFTGARDFRLRQGDVELGGFETIVAGDVRIATDGGSITLDGFSRIDASGPKGGSIELAARQAPGREGSGRVSILGGAQLLARGDAPVAASGAGSSGQGGRALIQTATADGSAAEGIDGAASIRLAGGRIDVSGSQAGRGGTVTLRAPRVGSGAGDDVAIAQLDTDVRGAAQPVVIEAYKVYAAKSVTEAADSVDGSNLSAGTDGRLFNESLSFIDGRGAGIRERLGPKADGASLRAGLEIRSSSDLLVSVNEFDALAANRGWNLQPWRFGNQPVGLTLRAAGDLSVVGSISDGFVKPTDPRQQSWSMPVWALGQGPSADLRLVAGADIAAARLDGVRAGSGDLKIDFAARTPNLPDFPVIRAAGSDRNTAINPKAPVTLNDAPVALVRTGTGRVDIAAGRDVSLGMAKFFVSAATDETEGYPVIFDRAVRDPNDPSRVLYYDVTLYGASVYTAGQADAASKAQPFQAPLNALNTHYGAPAGQLTEARFAGGGGGVSVAAGRDVTGPRNLAANWVYRQNGTAAFEGDPTADPPEPATPRVVGDAMALPRVVPQLVNNWLFRQGRSSTDSDGVTTFETLPDGKTTLNTAWWTRPDYFNQGIATLGGGDVTVSAGRNLNDVSVSAASNAYMPKAGGALVERGGGDLQVSAGVDVSGGVFYAQKGVLDLRAGGSLTTGLLEPSDRLGQGDHLAPVLALGDARASVTTGNQLILESVLNPTLTEQSVNNQPVKSRGNPALYTVGGSFDTRNTTEPAQAVRSFYSQFSDFNSYSASSSVALTALGGDVQLAARGGALAAAGGWEIPNKLQESAPTAGFQNLYTQMPPTLLTTAFSGDINTLRDVALSPASDGQLSLLAAGSVSIQLIDRSLYSLRMLDNDPKTQSNVAAPRLFSEVDMAVLAGTSTALEAHAASGLHAQDRVPALVVARSGDVLGDPNAIATLSLPKAARIVAGRDIVDLGLKLQHSGGEGDVSLLQAGRDVLDTTQVRGGSAPSEVALVVGGAGRLDVVAGRSVDLGNGSGVVTRGNLDNAYLPEGGASVRVLAGVKPIDRAAYAAFVTKANRYGLSSIASHAEIMAMAAFIGELGTPASAPGEVDAAARLTDLAFFLKLPDAKKQQFLGTAPLEETIKSLTQFDGGTVAIQGFKSTSEFFDRLAAFVGTQSSRLNNPQVWDRFMALSDDQRKVFLDTKAELAQRLGDNAAALTAALGPDSTAPKDLGLIEKRFFETLVQTGQLGQNLADKQEKEASLKTFDAFIAALLPDAQSSAGGNISNFGSQFKTEQGGAITMFAPAGSVFAGLTVESRPAKPSSSLGVFTVRGGAIQALVKDDFLVNKGRIFTLGGGDITLVSQAADIDAGRGSKTAASAPPPLITVDKDGNVRVDVSSSISGSGIATLKTRPDVSPGDVFAIAPRGVFDAGDAGVRSSGSVLVVAPIVLNAANISASGSVSGAAPVVAAPSLGSVSAPASAAAKTDDVAKAASGPTANAANYALSVDVVGMGDAAGDEQSEDERKKKRSTNNNKEKGSTQ